MKTNTESQNNISKGLSIDPTLYDATMKVAEREKRSFSFIVCRAIERDLKLKRVTADSPESLQDHGDLIDITEAGKILHLSVWTMRRRSRRAGDPIRRARSRLGKQKPMHFSRSAIEQLEREFRGTNAA